MIRFTIPGEPVGKQRPRTVQNGGRVHSFTPIKTVMYERKVALACRDACRGQQMPLNEPLCVELWFYLPIPKSASMRLRDRLRNDWVTKKPDIDNLTKSILDGCNGIAYADDNQIAATVAYKIYADRPRTEVIIASLSSRREQKDE